VTLSGPNEGVLLLTMLNMGLHTLKAKLMAKNSELQIHVWSTGNSPTLQETLFLIDQK